MHPLPLAPVPVLLLALLGLSLGSFLNVVIYRLPRGVSLVRPRSRCPHCSHPIRWRHNLPVAGWILLRGRCADCGAPISPRYPLCELAGGALTLLAFYALPSAHVSITPPALLLRAAGAAAFLLALLAVLWIDLEHRIIPDEISLGGALLGLALSPWTVGWKSALGGALVGAGALYACAWVYQRIRGKAGMGMGDVKLAAMLGAFLGLQGIILTILLASLLGSLLGITLMLLRRGSMSTSLPFGSFLAPAASGALFWGTRIWDWYFGFFPGR